MTAPVRTVLQERLADLARSRPRPFGFYTLPVSFQGVRGPRQVRVTESGEIVDTSRLCLEKELDPRGNHRMNLLVRDIEDLGYSPQDARGYAELYVECCARLHYQSKVSNRRA